MAEIVVTSENFEKEIMGASLPVLLDFWATWCGPCRMVAPIVEEIAHAYEGRIVVGKVDVDEEQQLAMRFGISSIPTIVLLKNGEVCETMIGYRPKEDFERLIDNHVG